MCIISINNLEIFYFCSDNSIQSLYKPQEKNKTGFLYISLLT